MVELELGLRASADGLLELGRPVGRGLLLTGRGVGTIRRRLIRVLVVLVLSDSTRSPALPRVLLRLLSAEAKDL